MFRAVVYVSCLLILGEMTQGSAQSPAAPGLAESDCAPPANFSKRFPKLTEKKALRKVNSRITYESPSLIATNNRVTGTEVDSNDLYARTMFGVAGFGRDHTYTAIVQRLEGPRTYSIRISDTEYTTGSQPYFVNELAELHIPTSTGVIVVPQSERWEEGFCSRRPNEPDTCFNTAIGAFTIDQALFEELAARDPAKPIEIAARKKDGTMLACPYYFSPLSFKATLLTIDKAYADALAKDARKAKR